MIIASYVPINAISCTFQRRINYQHFKRKQKWRIEMNVTTSEEPYEIIAKTCGCKERNRKVTYSFIDAYHGLCKDKKDIVLSEIQACERLMNDTRDEIDKNVIETEIAELKLTLDLLP